MNIESFVLGLVIGAFATGIFGWIVHQVLCDLRDRRIARHIEMVANEIDAGLRSQGLLENDRRSVEASLVRVCALDVRLGRIR